VWIAQTLVDSADPITGWVRNEAEGDVTLEAQGSQVAVKRFLKEVGERLARNIASAVRAEMAVLEGERGFGIQR
jgi:acylphosphatase